MIPRPKRIAFVLSEKEYELLLHLAAHLSLSISETLRAGIRELLKKEELRQNG